MIPIPGLRQLFHCSNHPSLPPGPWDPDVTTPSPALPGYLPSVSGRPVISPPWMEEIEIASVGDRISEGKWRSHSRFARAINFTDGEFLVSLVDESVGDGPLNILVRGALPVNLDSLTVGKGFLQLDSRRVEISPDRIYQSDMPGISISPGALTSNLLVLDKILREEAPLESLSFLLNRTRPASASLNLSEEELTAGSTRGPGQSSVFFRNYATRMVHGTRLLFGGSPPAGVRMLRGCGFGLTPAGDDFLAGVLFGFHFIRPAEIDRPNPIGQILKTLAEAGKSANIFCSVGLAMASEGRPFGRLKRLLEALGGSGPAEVRQAAAAMMAIGATSGADLMVGVLLAMRSGGERLFLSKE